MSKRRYPRDLNDIEWELIKQYLPKSKKTGRAIEVNLREILNAIFYQLKTGGAWNYLSTERYSLLVFSEVSERRDNREYP